MLKHCITFGVFAFLIASFSHADSSNLNSIEVKNQRAIDAGGSTRNYYITLPDGNEYYFSVDNWKSWHDASSFCNWIGMKLVNLNTVEKDAAIEMYISEISSTTNFNFWTAGKKVQNDFVWTGIGEKLTYNSWADGEPNGYLYPDGLCVELNGLNSIFEMWADITCSARNLFICEH